MITTSIVLFITGINFPFMKAIVNCCEFNNRKDVPEHFDYYHIHVPDFGVPSDTEIEEFIAIMDRHHKAKQPVVTHCVAGCGRTGQFIIAWCAKAGFIPKVKKPIEWIRSIRKCWLETGAQDACANRLTQKYRS
jgi:protein-tyrosine phosphatase